jgi:hypothetical protein
MFLRALRYILSLLAAVVTEKPEEETHPIPETERRRLVDGASCDRKNLRQRVVDVISRLHQLRQRIVCEWSRSLIRTTLAVGAAGLFQGRG